MNINPAVAENRYPVIESKRRFGPGAVETRRQAVASLPSIRFDQRLLRSVGADADSDDDQPSAFICSPIHELNSATVFGVSTVISIVEYIGDVHDAFCVTMITLSGTVSRGSTEVFGIVAGGRTDGEHGAGEMMVAVVAGGVRWRSLHHHHDSISTERNGLQSVYDETSALSQGWWCDPATRSECRRPRFDDFRRDHWHFEIDFGGRHRSTDSGPKYPHNGSENGPITRRSRQPQGRIDDARPQRHCGAYPFAERPHRSVWDTDRSLSRAHRANGPEQRRAGLELLDEAEAGGGDGGVDAREIDGEFGAVTGEHELAEQYGGAVGIVGDALTAQHW